MGFSEAKPIRFAVTAFTVFEDQPGISQFEDVQSSASAVARL